MNEYGVETPLHPYADPNDLSYHTALHRHRLAGCSRWCKVMSLCADWPTHWLFSERPGRFEITRALKQRREWRKTRL
jgi:hypothetical protein